MKRRSKTRAGLCFMTFGAVVWFQRLKRDPSVLERSASCMCGEWVRANGACVLFGLALVVSVLALAHGLRLRPRRLDVRALEERRRGY